MQLVECVPNFSEGRRKEVVDAIASVISSTPGIMFLDKEMDADHNRSVITLVGRPEAVKQAAFQATQKASRLIDLNQHKGEHPRIGATDVIPFVPLPAFGEARPSGRQGTTMLDCVTLAKELGEEIGNHLQIPVYLYEEAASRPDRRSLAHIRRGGFEKLRAELGKNPDRKPDFGPEKIHATAGATVVGARFFLIAYNINLTTSDIRIAKRIARIIRESSGGLPCVKALGVMLTGKNIAQVTMNLTNYKITSMKTVFERVKIEAEKLGTKVLESELIGLLPAESLDGTSSQELLITNFNDNMIIENRLKQFGTTDSP